MASAESGVPFALALPKYAAFKGPNNKYLGWKKGSNFLKFAYDDWQSHYVKHEVVEAENGDVHFKCCYNNKFWRGESEEPNSEWWIVADRDSPNTNRSTASCTLFHPIYDADTKRVSLRFLHLNTFVACTEGKANNNNEVDICLFAGEEEMAEKAVSLEVVNRVTLPQYVVFKGDNGMYLQAAHIGSPRDYYLQFSSTDIGSDLIRHEVEPALDSIGNVRIKCLYWNKYWRASPEWILADTSMPNSINSFLLYEPLQVDAHTVALRSLGNGRFCKRFTTNIPHRLSANTVAVDAHARLWMEEFRRRVHTVIYDLDKADIYEQVPLVLATASAENTLDQPATLEMPLTYTVRKSQSWSNSESFSLGASVEITARVPFIGIGLSVGVSAETTTNVEWGKSEETETSVGATYTVTVEPGRKVRVNAQCVQAKINVPFSYKQDDIFNLGETVVTTKTDGLYKGADYINIHYVASYIVD